MQRYQVTATARAAPFRHEGIHIVTQATYDFLGDFFSANERLDGFHSEMRPADLAERLREEYLRRNREAMLGGITIVSPEEFPASLAAGRVYLFPQSVRSPLDTVTIHVPEAFGEHKEPAESLLLLCTFGYFGEIITDLSTKEPGYRNGFVERFNAEKTAVEKKLEAIGEILDRAVETLRELNDSIDGMQRDLQVAGDRARSFGEFMDAEESARQSGRFVDKSRYDT